MIASRIQNVYVTSQSVGSARTFYERTLGLSAKFSDDERWVQYAIGGSNFAIASVEESAAEQGTIAVFEVDDIEATKAKAVKNGGAIVGERDMGSHGTTVTIRDPENNLFQLFKRA